ncbi:MAG: hypothetical protein GY861_12000 [bacterium]|nr:hypothetical protein [bacterium]
MMREDVVTCIKCYKFHAVYEHDIEIGHCLMCGGITVDAYEDAKGNKQEMWSSFKPNPEKVRGLYASNNHAIGKKCSAYNWFLAKASMFLYYKRDLSDVMKIFIELVRDLHRAGNCREDKLTEELVVTFFHVLGRLSATGRALEEFRAQLKELTLQIFHLVKFTNEETHIAMFLSLKYYGNL